MTAGSSQVSDGLQPPDARGEHIRRVPTAVLRLRRSPRICCPQPPKFPCHECALPRPPPPSTCPCFPPAPAFHLPPPSTCPCFPPAPQAPCRMRSSTTPLRTRSCLKRASRQTLWQRGWTRCAERQAFMGTPAAWLLVLADGGGGGGCGGGVGSRCGWLGGSGMSLPGWCQCSCPGL